MYTELLVPLDGSPLANAAVPFAVEIARRLKGGIHLVRVHTPFVVFSPGADTMAPIPDPSLDERAREEAQTWLIRRANELRTSAGVPVTSELRVGSPVEEIVAAAADRRVQAIVCSTHGLGGWALRWLGSVADGVIRHAPCPVLAMSEAAVARPAAVKKVLLLHDGSSVSDEIVPHAAWLARAFGAEIEMLRVVAPPWVGDSLTAITSGKEDPFGVDAYAEASKIALDALAANLRKEGLTVHATVVVHLSPSRAILEHIDRTNPDAIALATYGRGLSRLLLGSVADKVLRVAGRPTLFFRPSRHLAGGVMKEHEAGELLTASTPA